MRDLSKVFLTPETSEETLKILEVARLVKPDLEEPAAQVSTLANEMYINILSNSKMGTYIKESNKNRHFNNIGNPTRYANRSGYFLRKGIGAKLLQYVIDEQKEAGIKTLFVHPDNSKLELYYAKFGFKPLDKVPKNLNRPKILHESYGLGRLMYLSL